MSSGRSGRNSCAGKPVLKANREKKEQFAVLASMSEIYHSMHLIRLDENSVMEYSGTKEESEMGKNRENADQVIAELMKETALEVYGDQAEAFVDFTTLAKRMEGKKIISAEFVGKDLEGSGLRLLRSQKIRINIWNIRSRQRLTI